MESDGRQVRRVMPSDSTLGHRPVRIGDLELVLPLVNGSGALNVHAPSHMRPLGRAAASLLGAYVTKTVTVEPRAGNAQPWMAELPGGGVVNSVGIANPGIGEALREWRELLESLEVPIVLSIAGSSDELAAIARVVERQGDFVSAVELNLSCPNRPGVSTTQAAHPATVAECVRMVRSATSRPVIAKLTPLASDIAASACAAEQAGADAICAINTLPVRAVGRDGRQLLGALDGGLSGTPLFQVALRCVAQVRSAVAVPVIGIGGVDTPQAATTMLAAGADIVGVGTAAAYAPGLIAALAAELAGSPSHRHPPPAGTPAAVHGQIRKSRNLRAPC